jgi:hypothetical protein
MCRPFFTRSVGNLWESTEKHAAPSIFGFPKFSLNSNIEEKMCAALPDNLNQFKENFDHVYLQKKIQNLKMMIFKVNNKKLSNALYLQKHQNRELKEKLENVFTEDQLQAIRTKKIQKMFKRNFNQITET